MLHIFTYELEVSNYQIIRLPKGFQILAVQSQNNIPQLWAIVEPTNDIVEVKIRTVVTGHQINSKEIGNYLGTYQLDGGSLVFHTFFQQDIG